MGARGKSYTHVGHTLPPHRGCPTATRGDSATTTNDAQNTTTRPSPRAPRLPRDALGSLSTPHMRGTRSSGSRGSLRSSYSTWLVALNTTRHLFNTTHLAGRLRSYSFLFVTFVTFSGARLYYSQARGVEIGRHTSVRRILLQFNIQFKTLNSGKNSAMNGA